MPIGTTVGPFEGKRAQSGAAELSLVANHSLRGADPSEQLEIDELLTERLPDAFDASMALSLAVARLASQSRRQPLWRYLADRFATRAQLPARLIINFITGAGHADNAIDITEIMLCIEGPPAAAIKTSCLTAERFERDLTALSIAFGIGPEASVAPQGIRDEEALDILEASLDQIEMPAGVTVGLGFDLAGRVSSDRLRQVLRSRRYAALYIEDAMGSFASGVPFIAGDDSVSGDSSRLDAAVADLGVNAAVVKLSHFASLSSLARFVQLCRLKGCTPIASHRSQDCATDTVAQVSVGLGMEVLKAGHTARERIANYNALLLMEELI